jgi:hypothetical protein
MCLMLLYSHFQKFKLNCLPKTRSVFYKTAETVTKTGLWVSDFRTVIVHSFGYGSAVLANILHLFVGSSSTIDIFTVLNSQDQDIVIYDYKDDSVVTDTKLA